MPGGIPEAGIPVQGALLRQGYATEGADQIIQRFPGWAAATAAGASTLGYYGAQIGESWAGLPGYVAGGAAGALIGMMTGRLLKYVSEGGLAESAEKFDVNGLQFSMPEDYEFSANSAERATEPMYRGEARDLSGRGAGGGVAVGDVASYGVVTYTEQVGDGLTGRSSTLGRGGQGSDPVEAAPCTQPCPDAGHGRERI